MLQSNQRQSKPKRLEVLEDAIFNGIGAPEELQRYIYRREFGLSAAEMEAEPVDQFLTNITIYALIKKKEELMSKESELGRR
jgi:hypothetical protein